MTDEPAPPAPGDGKPLPRPYCRALKKNGSQCRNRSAAGSAYCGAHGGGARRVGAPIKLTLDVRDTIVEAVEAGLTYERAAAVAGVHRGTLVEWRNRGTEDLEAGRATVFADLADALTPASARGELELARIIREAATDDWRAALAILQARHPERWGRRPAVDVTSNEVSAPVHVKPTGSRRDAIMDVLGEALKAPPGAPT